MLQGPKFYAFLLVCCQCWEFTAMLIATNKV